VGSFGEEAGEIIADPVDFFEQRLVEGCCVSNPASWLLALAGRAAAA